jgi:hypothetical protein
MDRVSVGDERRARFSPGFVEEIEMIETMDVDNDTRTKRSTNKKRAIDVAESTVGDARRENNIGSNVSRQMFEQQKRGRVSTGHTTTTTTSGTSDFYSVASESESSYQTAGENDDFKPKFLKKLNDTLATGKRHSTVNHCEQPKLTLVSSAFSVH